MARRNKSSIPRDTYTPHQIIYKEKRLLGNPYQSPVISAEQVLAILAWMNGRTITTAVNEDCFSLARGSNPGQSDIYKIHIEEMYYQPQALLLYDDDSISNYYIVVIDDQCELRQTNYTNLLLPKQIDNSAEITDRATILKMENSVEQLLAMMEK